MPTGGVQRTGGEAAETGHPTSAANSIGTTGAILMWRTRIEQLLCPGA